MKQEPEDLGPDGVRLERIMQSLDRRPVHLPPRVRAAVMAEVRARPQSAWARSWDWLAAPRLSPLAGLAMAAGIAALLLLRPGVDTGGRAETVGSSSVPVRLILVAPQANSVAVTGDFASWDPNGIPLTKPPGEGVWSVDLQIPPGLHHYVFIVNGTEWRPDPNAASQVDDGFGQQNSVLLVTGRRAS